MFSHTLPPCLPSCLPSPPHTCHTPSFFHTYHTRSFAHARHTPICPDRSHRRVFSCLAGSPARTRIRTRSRRTHRSPPCGMCSAAGWRSRSWRGRPQRSLSHRRRPASKSSQRRPRPRRTFGRGPRRSSSSRRETARTRRRSWASSCRTRRGGGRDLGVPHTRRSSMHRCPTIDPSRRRRPRRLRTQMTAGVSTSERSACAIRARRRVSGRRSRRETLM